MSGYTIERHLPPDFAARALRADVQHGLTSVPKSLPPKWFYDKVGSELFEEITRLPEYYPTRAERQILSRRAAEIAAAAPFGTLVELGSGSSQKTRLLLDALSAGGRPLSYVPLDVSDSALADAARRLAADYPSLRIRALVADFTHQLDLLAITDDGHAPVGAAPGDAAGDGPRLAAFLGGTIGNLEPAQRARFLADLRGVLGPADRFLLGADLVKDPVTLVAAYDDETGVTAAFNRNLLDMLNQSLGADFDPGAFEHVALWDPDQEWIEMRLRARRRQLVRLESLDLTVCFEPGEDLCTEISAKFRRDGLRRELGEAGFALEKWWTDDLGRFSLSLWAPVDGAVR